MKGAIPGPVLALVVALAVLARVGFALHFTRRRERERAEALRRVAEAVGFGFETDGRSVLETLQGSELLSRGHSRRLANVLRGKLGDCDATIFDYRYRSGIGRRYGGTHEQTVVCFRSSRQALPAFSLRPEDGTHKMGQLFGYQDIDIESRPAFSSRWLLRGADEAAIRALFTERLLTFYEGEEAADCCTEGAGDRLLIYFPDVVQEPEDCQSFLEWTSRVLALFDRRGWSTRGDTRLPSA